LPPIPSEFPYIWEKTFSFLFYQYVSQLWSWQQEGCWDWAGGVTVCNNETRLYSLFMILYCHCGVYINHQTHIKMWRKNHPIKSLSSSLIVLISLRRGDFKKGHLRCKLTKTIAPWLAYFRGRTSVTSEQGGSMACREDCDQILRVSNSQMEADWANDGEPPPTDKKIHYLFSNLLGRLFWF